MGKILSSLLSVILLGIFASTAGAQESVFDIVKERGKVIIGLRKDAPPAGYINDKGEWVGLELDIADYIAKKLGVELERVEVTSRTRIPLLQTGNIDLFMAFMNPTRERDQVIDFSTPYYLGGKQLLVRKGSPIRRVEDMTEGRNKLGAVQGSFDHNACTTVNPDLELTFFQSWTHNVLALKNGQIDGLCLGTGGLIGIVRENADLEIVGPDLAISPWVMGIRQNDSKWRDFLNETIMDAAYEGIYEEWYTHHFGMAPSFKLLVWPDYYVK